jgi:hypothetical protein
LPDKSIAITPFSKNTDCSPYSNTWIYSGLNNTNGNILNQASDLIGVDSKTGAIFVSKYKPPGTYNVKIIGTLPENTTETAIFTIIIINTPPVL